MSELQALEQQAQVGAQLANAYLMGGLADQAGIQPPGYQTGGQLQNESAELMTELGIDISGTETGSLGFAVRAAATKAALKSATSKAAAGLAKSPGKWASALGIAAAGIGFGMGTYEWMSEDTQVRLAEVNAAQAGVAKALEQMTPEQRAEVAMRLASQTSEAPPRYTWVWMLGAVALGGFAIWRLTKDDK